MRVHTNVPAELYAVLREQSQRRSVTVSRIIAEICAAHTGVEIEPARAFVAPVVIPEGVVAQ